MSIQDEYNSFINKNIKNEPKQPVIKNRISSCRLQLFYENDELWKYFNEVIPLIKKWKTADYEFKTEFFKYSAEQSRWIYSPYDISRYGKVKDDEGNVCLSTLMPYYESEKIGFLERPVKENMKKERVVSEYNNSIKMLKEHMFGSQEYCEFWFEHEVGDQNCRIILFRDGYVFGSYEVRNGDNGFDEVYYRTEYTFGEKEMYDLKFNKNYMFHQISEINED